MDSDTGTPGISGGLPSRMVACVGAGVAAYTSWLVLIVPGNTQSVPGKLSFDLTAALADIRNDPSTVVLVNDGNPMHQPGATSTGDLRGSIKATPSFQIPFLQISADTTLGKTTKNKIDRGTSRRQWSVDRRLMSPDLDILVSRY